MRACLENLGRTEFAASAHGRKWHEVSFAAMQRHIGHRGYSDHGNVGGRLCGRVPVDRVNLIGIGSAIHRLLAPHAETVMAPETDKAYADAGLERGNQAAAGGSAQARSNRPLVIFTRASSSVRAVSLRTRPVARCRTVQVTMA
jgi:hypothetical protein